MGRGVTRRRLWPSPPRLRFTETGLAAVQLSSDMSVHKLSLDDISEYAGPAEEDEDY